MFNNFQYNDVYRLQLEDSKEKIDKLIDEKSKDGKLDKVERLKLEQQRFLSPLFDMTFGFNERFKNPW